MPCRQKSGINITSGSRVGVWGETTSISASVPRSEAQNWEGVLGSIELEGPCLDPPDRNKIRRLKKVTVEGLGDLAPLPGSA